MVDEDPGNSWLDPLIGEAWEYASDRRWAGVSGAHENSDASVRLDHGNGSESGTGRHAA